MGNQTKPLLFLGKGDRFCLFGRLPGTELLILMGTICHDYQVEIREKPYKMRFLPGRSQVDNVCIWTNEMPGEKLDGNAMYCFEKILEATPHKTAAVRPLASDLTNHSSRWTRHAGEVKLNS